MPDANIKEIMSYFGMSASEFSREWKALSDSDKAQLKTGIGNGTHTY
jgi:hypothetical protein